MKKTIALILSAALLLAASLCAFPVSAETENTDPINATPLTGYTVVNSWQYNADTVMPAVTGAYTTATGVKLSENYMGEIDLTANGYSSYIYAQAMYSEDTATAYKLPVGFAENGSFIIYVKTDAANKMTFTVKTECPSQWFTSGKINANGSYTYLETASDKWENATADENGIISFESAFDGYVRIPVSSLIGMDGVPMEFNYLAFIDIRFGGIGGKFGTVTVGPFFVTTENSASTKLIVPEEYRPAPLDIKTFDFGDVHAATYAFSADKLENANNYKLYIGDSALSEATVKYQGSDVTPKWSYLENSDGIEGADNWTALVMNTRVKTYMKDAAGIVFYVNFPKANMFAPCLTFDSANSIMLKPGEKVYVLQNGSDTWAEKSVENGYNDNTVIYGKVTFDSAFEGYIKVPFTSLNSDWGWRPTLNGDNMSALTSVALRFKGIGDDTMYGKEIIAGVTGYYTTDTARAEIGSVTKPEYAAGDANYDWKVDSQDLVDVRKTLLGAGTYTGYDVTLLDLIRIKKVLSNVQ